MSEKQIARAMAAYDEVKDAELYGKDLGYTAESIKDIKEMGERLMSSPDIKIIKGVHPGEYLIGKF